MTDTPRIFRVSIQVSQIDEAVAFYSELLGIKSRSVSASECYFECGAVVLLLSQTSRELLQSDQEQVNFSVRDIGAIHARASVLNCLAQGIIQDQPAGSVVSRPWGERSFFAIDPYGNVLCFVEADSTATPRKMQFILGAIAAVFLVLFLGTFAVRAAIDGHPAIATAIALPVVAALLILLPWDNPGIHAARDELGPIQQLREATSSFELRKARLWLVAACIGPLSLIAYGYGKNIGVIEDGSSIGAFLGILLILSIACLLKGIGCGIRAWRLRRRAA